MIIKQILFSLFAYSWATYTRADVTGKNWAVLVAGTKGWSNYRYQADIAHAYQILRANGIPSENIITMMYDDIAFNPRNPFPGEIFHDYSHKDVYKGVEIDYRGVFVSPDMFFRVMEGDNELKRAGKKVLDSGANDTLFLFFSGQGAYNFIAFPEGVLYAQQLVSILRRLKSSDRFKQAAVYIQADRSGSLFKDLLQKNVSVYAITATNSTEPSLPLFCDDKNLDICLANEFSYKWMKDTTSSDLDNRTLHEQFKTVKGLVNRSHVCEWGSEEVGGRPIGEFQSHNRSKAIRSNSESKLMPTTDRMPAHLAHLVAILRTLTKSKDEKERVKAQNRLHRALQLERLMIETCDEIVATVTDNLEPKRIPQTINEQLDCYEKIFDAFQVSCFTIKQVRGVAHQMLKFDKLCRAGYDASKIVHVIHDVCV